MTNRAYGQYCGLVRAAEIIGERWGLLIVRDLLVGPRRFTDLLRGLPGIPTNVLTTRLKELEAADVIRRRLVPRPGGAIVYELTPYGAELEEIVVRLGCWGAKSLGEVRPGEIVTPASMVMAMRSTFRPEAARGFHATYELHLGPVVVHMRVDDGRVDVGEGPVADADLVIEAGPAIRGLMAGEMTAQEAIDHGVAHITGDPKLFERFGELFRLDPKPEAIGA